MFVAVVVIGWSQGPAAQGLFSRVKSELEFVAAVVLLGLPQAVFFFLASDRLRPRKALTIAAVVALLAAAAALLYRMTQNEQSFAFTAMFALATSLFVAHGLMRVILLAHTSPSTFNAATALPQFIILMLTCIVVFVVPLLPWLSACLLAAAYSAGSAYALHSSRSPEIMAHARAAPGAGDVRLGELFEFSIASGGATLLNAAAVLFLVRFVETRLGASALGLVTMALMVSQIALMPVTLAAPLVFKHLMTRHALATRRRLSSLDTVIFITLLAVAAALVEHFADARWLGSYAELHDVVWPIAAAIGAELVLKLSSPAALAGGQPYVLLGSESARLVTLFLASYCDQLASLRSALITWAFAAFLCAVVLLALLALTARSSRS